MLASGHLLLHLLHLLHLCHLLHHCWVHAAHGHTSGHLVSGLLLHEGSHVLLHLGPVLRHHLGSHASCKGALAVLLVLVLVLIATGVVVVVASIISEVLSATSTTSSPPEGLVVFTHVPPRLSLLNFNGLTKDHEITVECIVDGGFTVKSYEAKTTGAAGVLVHHESGVDDSSELHEIFFEVGFSRILANTSDEDFTGPFLFIAWNRSLGINLKKT